MKSVRTIFLFLLLQLSPPTSARSHIIGGTPAVPGQIPYQAYVKIRLPDDSFRQCGGALIDPAWIVTAAHCLFAARGVQVALGATGPVQAAPLLNTSQAITHPAYDSGYLFSDIALVRLSSPVQPNASVNPITLAPRRRDLADGEPLTVSGWGRTEGDRASDVLLYARVHVYDFERCDRDWHGGLRAATQFCAGDVGRDTCAGDSGGPITALEGGKPVLVGIVSYGRSECGTATNAVYTKMGPYVDWIEDIVHGQAEKSDN